MEKREKLNGGALTNCDFEKAREMLKKRLSFDRIKKIPKYRNFKRDQYDNLLIKLEKMAVLLLESYIFEVNAKT